MEYRSFRVFHIDVETREELEEIPNEDERLSRRIE